MTEHRADREVIVVDAHVHFWDPSLLRYPWLQSTPALQRSFLPGDYSPLVNRTVDAAVFVEANCAPGQSASEVEFVESLAAHDPRIVGTVAFVDLLDERSRGEMLEHLSPFSRVAGIRHNIQGMPRGRCLDRRFVRGVQAAGRGGFTFDVCVTADQLHDVAELVEQCPDTQFVLDHCGKPAIREDAFDAWALDLEGLATFGNVSCKLSGLLTEARDDQRNFESLLPYAEHARACFGSTRLMYGSDWPVVTLAGDVDVWRSFTDRFTAGWSLLERQRFYADNAIRLYGLEVHALF